MEDIHELNFNTLTKIISKETNNILDDFIENVRQSIEHATFLNIANYILHHKREYNKVCKALGKELKEYDVAYDDEDDLTLCGEDFLLNYVHYEISRLEHLEWREMVGV